MANRQRAEARRKAAAKAARSGGTTGTDGAGGGSSRALLWVAVLAVAAIAVVGIVWAVSKGDTPSSAPGDTTTLNLPDSQPSTITGDPLAAYDANANPDPAVGVAAPVVVGKDFQGDPTVIDAGKNGPTMVVFLAHWCVHCNKELPLLLDWKRSGGVPAGLNVVAVATAVSFTAVNYPPAKWFSDKGWSWPVLVDEKQGDKASAGKVAQAFGASGWPYFVIIGADGQVRARGSGEMTIAQLETIVNSAMSS